MIQGIEQANPAIVFNNLLVPFFIILIIATMKVEHIFADELHLKAALAILRGDEVDSLLAPALGTLDLDSGHGGVEHILFGGSVFAGACLQFLVVDDTVLFFQLPEVNLFFDALLAK